MKNQPPEIIRDNKKRGEWAESVFVARAAENGLAVSKPSGDSESFDYVVGHPDGMRDKRAIYCRAQSRGIRTSRPDPSTRQKRAARDDRAVQVKCTIARQHNAKGYICNLKCNNKKYRDGSFDFVAAYAILEDTWYIVPETAIRGMSAITLCSTVPKYERYREAWDLLREASGCGDSVEDAVSEAVTEDAPMGLAMTRMLGAFGFFRNSLEKGGR